jgi:hypothetical protein
LRDSSAKSSRQLRIAPKIKTLKPAGIAAKERKERRENGMHRGILANGLPRSDEIKFWPSNGLVPRIAILKAAGEVSCQGKGPAARRHNLSNN